MCEEYSKTYIEVQYSTQCRLSFAIQQQSLASVMVADTFIRPLEYHKHVIAVRSYKILHWAGH